MDDEPDGPDEDPADRFGSMDYEEFLKVQFRTFVHQVPDPMLLAFVAAANKGLMEMGITLYVGGLVVSGTLVGASKFMDEVAEVIERTGTGQIEAIAPVFRETALGLQLVPDDEDDAPETKHVHLVDASIFSGQVLPIASGARWRGRLSSVDAWNLGTWSVE